MGTSVFLEDEDATLALGAKLAVSGLASELVFLHGDLGAGKTTLVRGFLRALGHDGAVKSPTYTLLETYELPPRSASDASTGLHIYHFDFYRIVDPRELGYMGIDELVGAPAVKLVEWPSHAGDRLPKPDIEVRLKVTGAHRCADIVDHR
ncbi:MAG: tRNA (adenosine(37)-N6)-threonylcarbamoyltransferase complex ATPase subunit type 1 TsaE [Gammaproteobacteria bacterium]|nr:tRNA (adenosine(37)-N6)-threonylcarbamoyltransferase complex ATPase subunit type 1 TsaE [Gammaproteobacteria bacterium]